MRPIPIHYNDARIQVSANNMLVADMSDIESFEGAVDGNSAYSIIRAQETVLFIERARKYDNSGVVVWIDYANDTSNTFLRVFND